VIGGKGIFTAAVSSSAAALSAACLCAGFRAAALLPAGLAAFWILAVRRGWQRPAAAPFPLLTLFAAIGLLRGMSPALCLTAVVCGMGAWDIARFLVKRGLAADADEARRTEKLHLGRLALILGIGGLSGAGGLLLRVRPGFPVLLGFAVLLAAGFLAFLGLSKAEEAGEKKKGED
jgi:hypothetical protein